MTDDALPTVMDVTEAFCQRLPAQRMMDLVCRMEQGVPFKEIAETQPFRLIAFRALLRDYPDRDATSLWMHAYDVEVQQVEADPTNGSGAMLTLPSALTGTVSPTT